MRAASEFAGEFGFGSQSRDWQKKQNNLLLVFTKSLEKLSKTI
jgi:hypothetical protein